MIYCQSVGQLWTLLRSEPVPNPTIDPLSKRGSLSKKGFLTNQVISSETLIGIEDLIGDSSITPEDRRAHSEMVIKMRSTLKRSSKEKDPNLLAKVAAVRSAGSVRRARDKAILAAAA